MVAPAFCTAWAVAINCDSLSTEHGPAMTWNFFPPMGLLRTETTELLLLPLAADKLVAFLHRHDPLDLRPGSEGFQRLRACVRRRWRR
jgi:hypothetical protein